ncbi:MAG: hypothetical protein GC206_12665 [Alphaproteobacteria bacterium]|nr:hypothetical protein [Alphaproteobacteria bacterium]
MRWFPDRGGGTWQGDMILYTAGYEPAHSRFRLEPARAGGWRICPLDEGMPEGHGPPCRDGFLGPGRKTAENGGEWMELRATTEALRFTHHVGPDRFVFFAGARDGCD